jgi:hypothetical protein
VPGRACRPGCRWDRPFHAVRWIARRPPGTVPSGGTAAPTAATDGPDEQGRMWRMVVTALPVADFDAVAAEALPAARPASVDAPPAETMGASHVEMVVPIFDDDGVMVRIVLAEDEDVD